MKPIISMEQIHNVVLHYTKKMWGPKAVYEATWKSQNIASAIYSYCEMYRIDPVLAMAQAIVEGHFGVAPTARRTRKTKNIYNVGNVDDGTDRQMESWEKGIETYCRLMHREYNYKDDADGYVTLQSMVQHKFTRPKGGVYATATNYTELVHSVAQRVKKVLGVRC